MSKSLENLAHNHFGNFGNTNWKWLIGREKIDSVQKPDSTIDLREMPLFKIWLVRLEL